jgi:type VI secretion system protein
MRAHRLLERVAACETACEIGGETRRGEIRGGIGGEIARKVEGKARGESRGPTGGERLRATRVDALIESILAHLVRILNTRQGSVPIDPAFGVPDFTNLGVGGGVGEWMEGGMNAGLDSKRRDWAGSEAGDGALGAGDGVGDGTADIAAAIARTLRRCEPRLLSPRVRRISSDTDILSLAFAIDGLIAADDREIPISIATRVSASGRVSLQRA